MAATKLRIYNDAARMLADSALALITDDVETRYQMDNAWASSVEFVLRQAAWRFALKSATLSGGGSPIPGFASSFVYPSDWLRTHTIKKVSAEGRDHPIDLREQGIIISTNTTGLTIRYVSSDYADPALSNHPWPEHFAQATAAYLAFSVAERVTGERGASNRMAQLFNQLLNEAIRLDAVPEDRWMPYQRSGEMLLGARDLLRRGNWRFALVDAHMNAPGVAPAIEFAHGFTQPVDWLRTYKLTRYTALERPFDVRETAGGWSTDLTEFIARYVSRTQGLDSTLWPEPFRTALLDYLDAGRPQDAPQGQGQQQQPQWQRSLESALAHEAEPPDRWLPHQLSGRFARASLEVLSQGYWRFAIKTEAATVGGTPAPGYSTAFVFPLGFARTHSLYVPAADGRKAPFDAREQQSGWSANVPAFTVRYVSEDGLNSTFWPEPFSTAVLAFCEMQTAEPDAEKGAAAAFAAALADAQRVCSDPPDPWLPHQLSGQFERASKDVLGRGYWRFAMKAVAATGTTGPLPGYLYAFSHPADRVRTHALYIAEDGREIPFDVREHQQKWSANTAAFTVRYISTAGLDSQLWPEPFATAVLALCELETAPPDAEQVASAAFAAALAEAQRDYSEPPDPWLPYQLDGSFDEAARTVMGQGFWVYRGFDGVLHGLKEVQYSYLDDQLPTAPGYAFPYRYPLPADHFRTHALYLPWDGEEQPINISETAHDWSTDAENFIARYVGSEVLDPATWPGQITKAVRAWLDWQHAPADQTRMRAEEYAAALAEAKAIYSRPENEWLRFQLNGSFRAALKEVLETGRWRFAVRTLDLVENTDPLPSELAEGTPSPGYGYRFIWPSDMIRPLRVYYTLGIAPYAQFLDVDYRDEQYGIHANYTPLTVRYVSRLGMDPTKWPAHFRDALLAWLQYREARGDPKMTPIAKAKMEAYEVACREAERLDDARDMPRVIGSRFTAARRGRGNMARQQGWYLPP